MAALRLTGLASISQQLHILPKNGQKRNTTRVVDELDGAFDIPGCAFAPTPENDRGLGIWWGLSVGEICLWVWSVSLRASLKSLIKILDVGLRTKTISTNQKGFSSLNHPRFALQRPGG